MSKESWFESDEFEQFANDFRRNAIDKITRSRANISIIDGGKDFNVKFALELGASIMLNKPIIVVAFPKVIVPLGLQRIAHKVIRADIDTEEGQKLVAQQIAAILVEMDGPGT